MSKLNWSRRSGPATSSFWTTSPATRALPAAAALHDIGAWFLFLPPYSPDLNPIEMAFAKLKALVRKAAARTYDQRWAAVGQVCNVFSDEECYSYFKAAGYEVD
ncbi:hypothetical protein E4191_20360 (plasmid) [Paracoccus liaowanqingii]|uniref:Tc1-like transposase DDE domain-containing protein n=1 Tax=Paracoccus liaowanqingii TaxID=2560053 RepID=A0A4Y5SSI0_9RHOB|nr:hypothetical protein E4191_20360 [Paracoccus liaowanqingii]